VRAATSSIKRTISPMQEVSSSRAAMLLVAPSAVATAACAAAAERLAWTAISRPAAPIS